jgi:hypothetical protein
MITVSIACIIEYKEATGSNIFRAGMGPQFARRNPENIGAGLLQKVSRILFEAITGINSFHSDRAGDGIF